MDASRFDYLLYRFRQDTLEDAELQEWREIVLSGRYDEQLGEDQEAILGHYETHALWNTEKQEHLLEQLHEKLGFEQDDKIISLSPKKNFPLVGSRGHRHSRDRHGKLLSFRWQKKQ